MFPKKLSGFSAALRSSLHLCVKNSAVPTCARTRAKALGNGLRTDRPKRTWRRKSPTPFLIEAIPEKRLGAPSPFHAVAVFPSPSVLVDPFHSVAQRFSASSRDNGLAGSLLFVQLVVVRSKVVHTRRRAEFSTAREKRERHEIAIRRAIPTVACAPSGQALSAGVADAPLAAG